MKNLKTLIFIFALISMPLLTKSQNTYPSSGNVRVFAVDEGWAEGVCVVKPSGWGGIRFARNSPATGNYYGNWAIGYNASTGNDFSISTNYNGAQYDGLFHISNSTRNVGIGTISPLTPLHLNIAAPSGAQSLNSLTKFTIDAANGGFMEFRNSADNGTNAGLLFTDNNLGGYVTFKNYPDDKLHLGAYGGIAFEVGTDNNVANKTERLRIDANGNVGIGTTAPGSYSRLNVVGGGLEISTYAHQLDASLHISTSYGQFGRLTQINPSAPNSPALNVMASTDVNSNYNWWAWGVTALGSWALQPSTGFGGSTGLFIDRNGQVGVGTASPTQKLTVNGTIYGKEVKVDLSVPGPDYVFKESYLLPTLEEVKSYIDENKHLPEVPSAKEMEKNGINVGEMNMLLLKKMEEMTLYVIELKNENDKLKERMTQIEQNRK